MCVGSMSASNSGSGDSMEWGRGRSTTRTKGKRGGGGSDKPRQPQRGLGVAQLEKIRIQSEMAEYLHHPLAQQPPHPIHRTGSFNSVIKYIVRLARSNLVCLVAIYIAMVISS